MQQLDLANCRLGLSPRVRGILVQHYQEGVKRGSIPACTGNPSFSTSRSANARVYPRVYGESVSLDRQICSIRGLSPRVRGIQVNDSYQDALLRSIPACTGNPFRRPRMIVN